MSTKELEVLQALIALGDPNIVIKSEDQHRDEFLFGISPAMYSPKVMPGTKTGPLPRSKKRRNPKRRQRRQTARSSRRQNRR